MNKRRIRMSTMEVVLVVFLGLALVLGFLQAWQEEGRKRRLEASRAQGA